MRCPYQDEYCAFHGYERDEKGNIIVTCEYGIVNGQDCKGKIEKEAGAITCDSKKVNFGRQ